MRLFLIDPHRKDFYNNGIFDNQHYPELIIFKQLRNFLKTKNIILDTIDLHPVSQADKIFFFDHEKQTVFKSKHEYLDQCQYLNISKNKLNLVIWECPIIKPKNWSVMTGHCYGKIFTWNDQLIDKKKYFHFRWPQHLIGINTKLIPYSQKKLLTLINTHKTNYCPNELYSLRINAIRYFEKNHKNYFDLYGIGWSHLLNIKYFYSALAQPKQWLRFMSDYVKSYQPYTSYQGPVSNKYSTLNKYRFALCFENMTNIDGYITEKIFDCFKAKIIPIYFGANNITKYIPKDIFIDWRLFNDFPKLFSFLNSVTDKKYSTYINKIIRFNKTIEKNWGYRRFAHDVFLIK